jgi:hypothetical protein
MRTLTDTLKKAQQAGTLSPIYKIVLTKGAMTYTYDKTRILPSKHDEQMYSQTAEVVLDNSDGTLTDIDLKGFDGVISYGVISSAGEEYSACAPLAVIDQQFDSTPNKLTCTLFLEGIPNLMMVDEAKQSYIPDEDDEETVKDLIEGVCEATLDCFAHCISYEVIWDDGYDTLADTYMPKDGFRIYVGSSRLAALRKLLDYTSNVPRFRADGKIHIMKPVTSGTTYDYEYSLESGHVFFSKAYRNSVVIPNKVWVISREDDDPQYSGEAEVEGYDSLPANVKKRKYVQMRLESSDQATSIAEALLVKAEMGCKRGQAEVPLNVGAEVFDYDKVTDSRQGDARTGNLGYVHRRFGPDTWRMTFGFGNWYEYLQYQKTLKELEVYTGQYFDRLSVGNLYVENIQAGSLNMVWIDPDGNIDLSKIGDTLDNLPDGEVYARVKSLHLSAEGGIKLDENVIYSPGYNPTEKEKRIAKLATAPTDPELDDFWLDTSVTPNLWKRWNGSAWVKATPATSVTTDGIVLLDQVQIGTYGLVKSTCIRQGEIRLDSCYGDLGDIDGNLDDLADGATWGRIRIACTDGNGYMELNSLTKVDGLWYNQAGVKISSSVGIDIFGPGTALRTRASDGGAIQCYVGSDGSIYAGGGAIKLNSSGLTVLGTSKLIFYSGATFCGTIDPESGGDLYIGVSKRLQISTGQGMKVPEKSSNPLSPVGGVLYYDTTKNLLCYYRSGVGWRILQDNPY